ncbi:hypothetical protein LPB140_10570 [Sphingorhabdus lutea]|uniref:J domain-containing protein n=1 Tax=Sphingorhabdus lutea TaxID=1913578 RepID=A0A1L3JDF9_9SPHN|nr:DnaJ domain-containing protein [Sphingorhabdus lutea]APG63160.1 hypothetical protein LPB140_10570 [Sphingorhabdus lutea]
MNKEKHDRYAGRIANEGQICMAADCNEAGEFRAPPLLDRPSDGPPQWRYYCLEHVRAFNKGYNFFDGMDAAEIHAAQHPASGWHNPRSKWPDGSDHFTKSGPAWNDFSDPLDAIGARFREYRQNVEGQHASGHFSSTPQLPPEQARALKILGLSQDADGVAIRKAYAQKLRQYHPDNNKGERRFETKLQEAVDAYQLLRAAANRQ